MIWPISVSALSTVDTWPALFSALIVLPLPIELTAPAITVPSLALRSASGRGDHDLVAGLRSGPPGVTSTASEAGADVLAPSRRSGSRVAEAVRICCRLPAVRLVADRDSSAAASTCAASCWPPTGLCDAVGSGHARRGREGLAS